ncbi:unnamed protein product [Bathycoccus prasinos]
MPSTEEDNKDDWEKDDEEEEEQLEEQQHQGDFVEEGLRQRRVWRGEENIDAFNATTTTTSVDDDANVNVNEDDESGREEEEEEEEEGGVEHVNAIMNGFRLAVESFERSGNVAALAEYTAQLRESFPAELRDVQQQEHLLEHVLSGDARELRAGITRMRGNLNALSRLVPSTDALGLQGGETSAGMSMDDGALAYAEAQALMRNASLVHHQALLANTDVRAEMGEEVPPVDNGLPLGAVESDFDVERAVHADEDERYIDGTGRDEAVNHGIVEDAEKEAEEEADDETVRIWKRFDQLVAKVKMRRTIAFGFEEDDDDESDIEDEPTTSRVEDKKIERDRKLNVPKNWRMSADGIAVPAEHRRGLRSIFIPGRVWFGTIWIPGSEKKSRYTFRVLFWDEERELLVCSHSAQGDEQTFYLHAEEQGEDNDNLKISFRDNETFCDGQVFPNGVIRGQVRQMIRGYEGHYEPANETQNLFELKIAKWTPIPDVESALEKQVNSFRRLGLPFMSAKDAVDYDDPRRREDLRGSRIIEEEVKRTTIDGTRPMKQNRKLVDFYLQRKRWAMSREILPSVKDALLHVKNARDFKKYEQMKRSMLETLVGSTRLLSFPKGFSCFESDVEEIAKCQDNSLGGHVYYDENEMSDADSIALEEEPESNAMMFFNTFYSADFVDYKDNDQARVHLSRAGVSLTFKHEKVPRQATREYHWFQFWEVAKSESELLSASLRETASELQNEIFATPREKLIDLSKRHRLKHKAHADMSDRICTPQALVWRLVMDAKYLAAEKFPPEYPFQVFVREAIRMGMFAHNVMEARMMQAYKLLDDSFNAYANRVPLSEFVNRVTSFQVPASIAPSGRPVTPSTLKNVCAICLVDFEENDRVLTLECNHVFHESCAKEWLFKSSFPSCPNCRKRVNDGVGEYLMASSNEERAELTLLVDCDYVRENFLTTGFVDDDDVNDDEGEEEEEEDDYEEEDAEDEQEEEHPHPYAWMQREMRDVYTLSDLEAQQIEEEEQEEEEDAYDWAQREMRDMQHVSEEAQQREEEQEGENRYL